MKQALVIEIVVISDLTLGAAPGPTPVCTCTGAQHLDVVMHEMGCRSPCRDFFYLLPG